MQHLTGDFRETVKGRANCDPEFRAGLCQEAMQARVDGDFGTAKIVLRDFWPRPCSRLSDRAYRPLRDTGTLVRMRLFYPHERNPPAASPPSQDTA